MHVEVPAVFYDDDSWCFGLDWSFLLIIVLPSLGSFITVVLRFLINCFYAFLGMQAKQSEHQSSTNICPHLSAKVGSILRFVTSVCCHGDRISRALPPLPRRNFQSS